MLSRSNLSMRRLIRPEAPYDAEDTSEPDEVVQIKLQDQIHRALSTRVRWSKKKTGSQDQQPVLVQDSQSGHRLSSSNPSICDSSPRSSKVSFSLSRPSLERHRQPSSKKAASTLPPPLSSLSGPSPDDLFGPTTNSASLPDILRSSGGLSTALTPLQDTTTVKCPAAPLFPIPDATEPETPQKPQHDFGKMTEVEASRKNRDSLGDWAATLQKLIEETEEAFKPQVQDAGAALPHSPPQLQSQSQSSPDVPSPPKETEPLRSLPAAKTSPQIGAAQLNVFSRKPVARQMTPPLTPPPLATPTRRSPVSKATPTRTGSTTKTYKKHKPSASKKIPKWLLSENVTGILTGQFFKKVEADEMLTPEQLEAVRASAEFQRRKKQSSDIRNSVRLSLARPIAPAPATSSSGDDQPRASGGALPTLKEEGEATKQQPQQQQQEQKRDQEPTAAFPVPSSTESRDEGDFKDDDEDDDDDDLMWLMVPTGLRPPPPPPKNPARQAGRPLPSPLPFNAPHQPLPAIPDVIVTAPAKEGKETKVVTTPTTATATTEKASEPQTTKSPWGPTEDDEFIYYHSTPYSFTMPTFRHGPIRLPKPDDMVPGMQLAPDNTLDWTAFQMAILGGAGDFFSDPSEFTGHANPAEVQELTAWFESFGFDSPGKLLTSEEEEEDWETEDYGVEEEDEEEETRQRAQTMESLDSTDATDSSSRSSTSSTSSSTKSRSSLEYSPSCSTASDPDLDLPIPLAEEYPSGFWNGTGEDAARFLQGQGRIKRWTMEGHPRKPSLPLSEGAHGSRRNSVGSLAQKSPMMDFVFLNLDDEDDEVVPMGYNLHHDLGDFLKWEAENAYACSPWGFH